MEQELRIPTEFTVQQLQRMASLVQSAHSQRPTPEDHNLLRKLTEYSAVASSRAQLRRVG